MITLGIIPHPIWMITILQMNKKTTVQIEYGLHVQSYKFRDGAEVTDLKSAEVWLTLSRKREIQAIFESMTALHSSLDTKETDLPEIF